MKKYFGTIKKLVAFTLIELIIVIAIISILAAIVVLLINPSTLFGNGRNSRRSNDLSTYQSSLSKFLADSPPTGSSRSLDSFVGMSSLYSSATSASPYGNCPGLSNGVTSNINGGYLIIDANNNGNPTNSPNTINIQPLIDNGYLNGVILNPYGSGSYLACVDTANNNQLVIYDPTSDNMLTVSKPVINLDITSLVSITSGSGNGGGASGNSVSYICPTGSTYTNGNCTPQSTYYSSILGTTGSGPAHIVIDSSGNVYTGNLGANNISKITPAGISSILATTGYTLQNLAIDSSDNIYATDTNQYNSIIKITPAGIVTLLGSIGGYPSGIAVDSAGNIYVPNGIPRNVSKTTPGGISSYFSTSGSGGQNGITVDSTNNVYIANTSSNNLSKITPTGISSILGSTGSGPISITIDTSGNIYTANSNSNNISKITPSGVSSILGTPGSSPARITVDSFGNVYSANSTSNNVSKITPTGVSNIIGSSGSNPLEIKIDPSGNVYTANSSSNNISKLSPNQNAILSMSPSTIKVGQSYTLGLNNVISSGSRVNSGTCSIQVTDTITTTVLQTLSSNMNNGACKPTSFNAVATTHPLSILATISVSSQTFTYLTTPQ